MLCYRYFNHRYRLFCYRYFICKYHVFFVIDTSFINITNICCPYTDLEFLCDIFLNIDKLVRWQTYLTHNHERHHTRHLLLLCKQRAITVYCNISWCKLVKRHSWWGVTNRCVGRRHVAPPTRKYVTDVYSIVLSNIYQYKSDAQRCGYMWENIPKILRLPPYHIAIVSILLA